MFKKNEIEKQLNDLSLKIEEQSIYRLYNFFQEREPHQKEVNYLLKQLEEGKISSTRIKENIMNAPLAKKIQREKLLKFNVVLENEIEAWKEINKKRFYFDPNDQPLFEFSILQYEKNSLQWKNVLKNYVKKNYNVIDIGANIGLYTILISELVGNEGKVFAFEPSPKTFQFLQRNIEYNRCINVKAFQKAVANNVGKLNFVQISSVHSYLLKNDRPHPKKISVPTTTIDVFLEENNEKIDFLFMDAEGFEEDIIMGGSKTIQNNQELKIFTEYNPGRLVAAGTTPESFIETILEFGFKIYVLDEAKGQIDKISKKDLLSKYSIKNEFPLPKYTNLYLNRE